MNPADLHTLEALQTFMHLAPVGLVQVTPDGEILSMNPRAAQWLPALTPSGTPANLFEALQHVAPDLRSRVADFKPPQGTVLDALPLHLRPAAAEPGPELEQLTLSLIRVAPGQLMAVIDDTTAAARRERELQQGQAWMHSIVRGVVDQGLGLLDHRGRCRDWNASLARTTGYDADSLAGRSPSLLCCDPAAAELRLPERLRQADACGWSHDEAWMARPDGTRYWGSTLIAPLRLHDLADPGPRCYSLIVRDISPLREGREALPQQVSTDTLTGLSNRRAFFEATELEMARSRRAPRPLALVLIDAGDARRVEGELGHPAGDAVLRHLAAGLTATFRGSDRVARVGNESFAALLPGADAAQATRVARRLAQAVAGQSLHVDGKAVRYTVQTGVAAWSAADTGADSLFDRAARALHEAQRHGRSGGPRNRLPAPQR